MRALQGASSLDDLHSDQLVAQVRDAYLDWLGTQKIVPEDRGPAGWLALQPALRAQRAPGITCLSALRAGGHGTIDTPINDSKGCGAAMRAAPLGLLPMMLSDACEHGIDGSPTQRMTIVFGQGGDEIGGFLLLLPHALHPALA